jgi:hypothetical protein
MWLDVTLLVSIDSDAEFRRNRFDEAMLRRGWSTDPEAHDAYRVAIRGAESDDEIVQICERDVKQSAYVAGVGAFQATCLIADQHAPAL